MSVTFPPSVSSSVWVNSGKSAYNKIIISITLSMCQYKHGLGLKSINLLEKASKILTAPKAF